MSLGSFVRGRVLEKILFISHASEDGATVQRIADYLEARGVSCWIAGRDIPPKAIYAQAIGQAMQNAQACAVIVSRNASGSDAIQRELELANGYRRPFIPIRIDDTKPGPGLDYYLNNVQWMEYKRDGDAALDRIVLHMRGQDYVAPPKAARERRAMSPIIISMVAVLVISAAVGGGYLLRGGARTSVPQTMTSTVQARLETTASATTVPPTTTTQAEAAQAEVSLGQQARALRIEGHWEAVSHSRYNNFSDPDAQHELECAQGQNVFWYRVVGDTIVQSASSTPPVTYEIVRVRQRTIEARFDGESRVLVVTDSRHFTESSPQRAPLYQVRCDD